MTDTWTEVQQHHRATAAEATEALREAAKRVRDLQVDLADARHDRDALITRIAASEILPKTQIADAAGVSRSKLYIHPAPDREVTP